MIMFKKPIMKPSNFTKYPYNSVFKESEYETVAVNIMVILKRTGDKFRSLSWGEYKSERELDGDFSLGEKSFFDQVKPYTRSKSKAVLFSKTWRDATLTPATSDNN